MLFSQTQKQYSVHLVPTGSVLIIAALKLIINYMCSAFQEFYALVQDNSINWVTLNDSLKINENKYPNNSEMFTYFYEIFNGKTANINRTKWHSMDKLLCVWVVVQFCSLHKKNMLALEKEDFKSVANILGIHFQLLEFKWLKLIKPYIKNKPWCEAEDLLIAQLMKSELSKKWTDIAITLSKSNFGSGLRTAKQVRQRWINYIDPSINRGEWSNQEDQLLIRLVRQHGRKWSILGKYLKRTENSIKNRFNSLTTKFKELEDMKYDPSRYDMKNQSSQQSGSGFVQVKQEEPEVVQFYNFFPQIMSPMLVPLRPIEFRTCGYRFLQPNELA